MKLLLWCKSHHWVLFCLCMLTKSLLSVHPRFFILHFVFIYLQFKFEFNLSSWFSSNNRIGLDDVHYCFTPLKLLFRLGYLGSNEPIYTSNLSAKTFFGTSAVTATLIKTHLRDFYSTIIHSRGKPKDPKDGWILSVCSL